MPTQELQVRPAEHQTVAPFGCQNCRDQHLKCDRGTPACGRCLANGKDCKRGYKFRVKSGPFNQRQQWVKTPRKLEFVEDGATDEGESLEEDAHSEPLSSPSAHNRAVYGDWRSPGSEGSRTTVTVDDRAQATAANNHHRTPSHHHHPSNQRTHPRTSESFSQGVVRHATQNHQNPQDHPNHQDPQALLDVLPSAQLSQPRAQSPSDRFIVHDEFLESSPTFGMSGQPEVQSRIYLNASVYPLQDKQEAILLRHYVQNLAIWLDLCEPTRPFSMTVPQRAGSCQVLLYAIFALAAKHLAHHGSLDPYISDRYHQQCLKELIPLLSDEATAADENLFAATIILRVLEEMEVKHTGVDFHSYLLGIHAFVHGHGHNLLPNTLSAAAFWVGLRQEIYSATINHQPVVAPLASSLVDEARSLGSTADQNWANRAVIHCVDVLNFCFGESPRRSWDELNAWNQRWKELVPPSYTPTFDKEPGPGEAFPEIWFHNTWHVTGVQHHILAELYLISFDPKIPRIGAHRIEASKRMEERIKYLVRRICGIGLGNQWTPPALFAACMAISSFGDRFHDRVDQEAMLDVLRLTEKDHGRPTESVQQQMMRSWGASDG